MGTVAEWLVGGTPTATEEDGAVDRQVFSSGVLERTEIGDSIGSVWQADDRRRVARSFGQDILLNVTTISDALSRGV